MKPKPFSELNHLTVPCAMFCLLDRWWKRTVNHMTDRVVPATGTFANLTWRKITRPQHLVLRAWSNTNTKQTTIHSQPQPPRQGDRTSPSGHERDNAAHQTERRLNPGPARERATSRPDRSSAFPRSSEAQCGVRHSTQAARTIEHVTATNPARLPTAVAQERKTPCAGTGPAPT